MTALGKLFRTTAFKLTIVYLIVFALGFASGFGVRDHVSRKRRREAAARRGL